MTHFPQSLGFDLTNPFTSHLELAAHFLKRATVAVLEAETLFKNFAFALSKCIQDVLDLVLEHGESGLFHRVVSGLVFDEVTEGGVIGVTNRSLE